MKFSSLLRTPPILSVLATCFISSPTLQAVVIVTGDGSGNTTAPGDDPGFANVGTLGSGSAVYLGNRWILTAAHLSTGGGTAIFGGTTYGFVMGTDTRLSNPPAPPGPPGPSGVVDLRMIRLDADPGLPTLVVASAAPSVGDSLVMIGRGRNRHEPLRSWSIDTGPDPDVWTSGGSPVAAQGYTTAGAQAMRWGANKVFDTKLVIDSGWGETRSFSSRFDSPGEADEAQAVTGDSGGGVFHKNGVSWGLIGIIHTVGTFDGQPGHTAVFGNKTNAADLSYYSDDIDAIVATPEPGVSTLAFVGLALCLRRRR